MTTDVLGGLVQVYDMMQSLLPCLLPTWTLLHLNGHVCYEAASYCVIMPYFSISIASDSSITMLVI